jgi:hypothetical protein
MALEPLKYTIDDAAGLEASLKELFNSLGKQSVAITAAAKKAKEGPHMPFRGMSMEETIAREQTGFQIQLDDVKVKAAQVAAIYQQLKKSKGPEKLDSFR